jgi:hypothetical protein
MLWRMSEQAGYSVRIGVLGNHLFKWCLDESYRECRTLGMSRQEAYRVRTRAPRSNEFVTCPNSVMVV